MISKELFDFLGGTMIHSQLFGWDEHFSAMGMMLYAGTSAVSKILMALRYLAYGCSVNSF